MESHRGRPKKHSLIVSPAQRAELERIARQSRSARSTAYEAIDRWNEARGLSAEKLDTLASLVNSKLRANDEELDRMWTSMILMDEHTFDSWNSVSDPESNEAIEQSRFKEHYAVKAAGERDPDAPPAARVQWPALRR